MEPTLSNNLGAIVKQRRLSLSLTLRALAARSGVSASQLSRVERGERFPAAHVLQKITRPLGFEEGELFTLAEYLSPQSPMIARKSSTYSSERLDPYVPKIKMLDETLTSVELSEEQLSSAECVVVATDHSCYDYQHIVNKARLVFDTRGATKGLSNDIILRLGE